ncbi:hypothetical protein Lalb_Chr13g0297051 [Lupinus albus]|uniref:Uncharacterized protein n=1 Tax=Lupinus albus TaxID=3870 RepID=A0A6A4PJ51_LUPAL|nr:hypothetical protein Lalb_Chr13g0297051 [Lupinus albus]
MKIKVTLQHEKSAPILVDEKPLKDRKCRPNNTISFSRYVVVLYLYKFSPIQSSLMMHKIPGDMRH